MSEENCIILPIWHGFPFPHFLLFNLGKNTEVITINFCKKNWALNNSERNGKKNFKSFEKNFKKIFECFEQKLRKKIFYKIFWTNSPAQIWLNNLDELQNAMNWIQKIKDTKWKRTKANLDEKRERENLTWELVGKFRTQNLSHLLCIGSESMKALFGLGP